jgi:hypothetical protein
MACSQCKIKTHVAGAWCARLGGALGDVVTAGGGVHGHVGVSRAAPFRTGGC